MKAPRAQGPFCLTVCFTPRICGLRFRVQGLGGNFLLPFPHFLQSIMHRTHIPSTSAPLELVRHRQPCIPFNSRCMVYSKRVLGIRPLHWKNPKHPHTMLPKPHTRILNTQILIPITLTCIPTSSLNPTPALSLGRKMLKLQPGYTPYPSV